MNILHSRNIETNAVNVAWLDSSLKKAIEPFIGIEEDSTCLPNMQRPQRVEIQRIQWRTADDMFDFSILLEGDYLVTLTASAVDHHEDGSELLIDSDELLVATPVSDQDNFEDQFAAATVSAIARWF